MAFINNHQIKKIAREFTIQTSATFIFSNHLKRHLPDLFDEFLFQFFGTSVYLFKNNVRNDSYVFTLRD